MFMGELPLELPLELPQLLQATASNNNATPSARVCRKPKPFRMKSS
jgi:hypothetical protein